MSAYPGALDSFTSKTDNVDDALAAHVNALQAAVVAIETELGTDPASTATDLKTRLAKALGATGLLNFAASVELTIATGSVTLTQNWHTIDTQADAASDDLDTIVASGVADGAVVFLRANHTDRTVVLKNGTGNLACSGGADLTLDDTSDLAIGIYDATLNKWIVALTTSAVATASEVAAGIVELATTAEAKAGSDTARAVTPAGLREILLDGWIPVSATWTYATAETATVPAGAAAIYSVGDKVRWKEGGAYKHAYIIAVADAQLTIKGDTFAGGAITDNYYSKASSPVGFPQWFAYTPTGIAASNVTLTGRFVLNGRVALATIKAVFTGAITFTTNPTLPIVAGASVSNDAYNARGVGGYYDNGGTHNIQGLIPIITPNATTVVLRTAAGAALSASAPITWANGDELYAQFSYEI